MRIKQLFIWSGSLCVVLAGISGCSSSSGPVPPNDASLQGSVLLNRQPAGPLCLVFYSDSFGKVAEIQVDSKGVIQSNEKIPAGGYAIAIDRPATGALPAGIPPAYFVETSGVLRVDLQPGVNEVKLEIAK